MNDEASMKSILFAYAPARNLGLHRLFRTILEKGGVPFRTSFVVEALNRVTQELTQVATRS